MLGVHTRSDESLSSILLQYSMSWMSSSSNSCDGEELLVCDTGTREVGSALDLLAVIAGSASGALITLRSFPHSFPALLEALVGMKSAATAVSSAISAISATQEDVYRRY